MAKSYYNVVEKLVSIFAEDKGTIKILLQRKKTEPYRNYWIIPGKVLSNDETLEVSVKKVCDKLIPFDINDFYETKTFSSLDRDPVERIIATNFNVITSKVTQYENMQWFDINALPKMAYDHEQILFENLDELKRRILHNENNILLQFFPHDFTLTELQAFFEFVLDKKIDRRNFRKKIFNDNIVSHTGEKIKTAGRPGELFVFNKGGYFNE